MSPRKGSTLREILISACVMLRRNPQYVTPLQMEALKASIQRDGFLSPILVRPLARGRYEVISGSHRLMAARELGLITLPAIVRTLSNAAVTRVAVNLNTIHGDPAAELLAPFLAELDAAGLAELHLEADMLEALGAFDAELAAKLGTLNADVLSPGPPSRSRAGVSLSSDLRYQVIVACADEQTQCALLDRFAAEGLECRALIS